MRVFLCKTHFRHLVFWTRKNQVAFKNPVKTGVFEYEKFFVAGIVKFATLAPVHLNGAYETTSFKIGHPLLP